MTDAPARKTIEVQSAAEGGLTDEAPSVAAERIETQANTNAISRAISVMVLMFLPGIAGSYLDRWLGTQFFVLIGFLLGVVVAIFGLLMVANIADQASKKSRDMRKSEDAKSKRDVKL